MIKQMTNKIPIYSLAEKDIQTEALSTATAIRAGAQRCDSDSRAETTACCKAKGDTVGPVKCEADIGGEHCYCSGDYGTGDWD